MSMSYVMSTESEDPGYKDVQDIPKPALRVGFRSVAPAKYVDWGKRLRSSSALRPGQTTSKRDDNFKVIAHL